MLIRKDKEFAHDASIIQTLVSEGYVTGELKKGFPAINITNPDNFVSLLYYFGMLTISGTYKGKTKLTIPNQVVREQPITKPNSISVVTKKTNLPVLLPTMAIGKPISVILLTA